MKTEEQFRLERLRMVEETIAARGVRSPDVLRAMRAVPRHLFVLPEYIDRAYDDRALPIDHGQTISQPYIVARMTDLLDLNPNDRILEIGTGSGYQAAVLAELGPFEIYSIEYIAELAQQANTRLTNLGYTNVKIRSSDGYSGWPEAAPFNAILITAAIDHLPPPLASQLAENGRIVMPLGVPGGIQTLRRYRLRSGILQAMDLEEVQFVPIRHKF